MDKKGECVGKCAAQGHIKPPRTIVSQIHRTDHMLFRRVNQIARDAGVEDVTITHGWILRYLALNQQQDVYQRDLEKQFSVTRSTITSTLQLMEKKGYIRRESVSHDARLKRLQLTPEGYELHLKLRECFIKANGQMEQALTPEENEELMRLLDKLQKNLHETAMNENK